ncbi:heterodisulfide reductase-related iron-sulfur binding cluster, partial [Sporolactobacillus kofuensis]
VLVRAPFHSLEAFLGSVGSGASVLKFPPHHRLAESSGICLAALHTSCHMTRLLGERESHYTLLKHVKGLDLVQLPNNYDCCGFGGTFSVKMFPISEQMVDEKIRHIEETEADVVIGADASCLMNIGGRMKRLGKPIKVMHIAQILNSHQTEGDERHADASRKSTVL